MTSRLLIFMWSEEPSSSDLMCDIMLSRGHGGQGRFSLQNLILGQHITSKLVSKDSRKWNNYFDFCCLFFLILSAYALWFLANCSEVISSEFVRSGRLELLRVRMFYGLLEWYRRLLSVATTIACWGKRILFSFCYWFDVDNSRWLIVCFSHFLFCI